MSRYIGSGSLSLPLFLSDSGPDGMGVGPVLVGPPGRLPGPDTNWAAQLSVQYNYSVPEPATLWLAGLGAVVLLRLVRQPGRDY
jgi:hypothetical protein